MKGALINIYLKFKQNNFETFETSKFINEQQLDQNYHVDL